MNSVFVVPRFIGTLIVLFILFQDKNKGVPRLNYFIINILSKILEQMNGLL